jgi:hypothetical protein
MESALLLKDAWNRTTDQPASFLAEISGEPVEDPAKNCFSKSKKRQRADSESTAASDMANRDAAEVISSDDEI